MNRLQSDREVLIDILSGCLWAYSREIPKEIILDFKETLHISDDIFIKCLQELGVVIDDERGVIRTYKE